MNLNGLLVRNYFAFEVSINEKPALLLKYCRRPILLNSPDIPLIVDLRPLKSIFSITGSSHLQKSDSHRAGAISASQRSALRHSVHGNAPTIPLYSIRTLVSVLPTRITLQSSDALLVIIYRDPTKAFLWSSPSQRPIPHKPALESFNFYLLFRNHVWRAHAQLCGKVETRLY